MTASTVDPDQPLALHPLTFLDEGDEVTVGRVDIDSYGVFPPDGAALLRELQNGRTVRDSGLWYAEQYGETVDMDEFIEVLAELELLDTTTRSDAETAAPQRVRWQRLGVAVFSPPAWLVYLALVAAALVLLAREPALVPRYSSMFFTSSLVAIQLGLFVGQIPCGLIHEGAHALAGRRLGLRSTLRINRRFYFIVFETALDGLAVVPRRKRFLPILAGVLADVVVVAVLVIVAAAVRGHGVEPLLGRFCLAMAFSTMLRIAWQFYFFLRTDLYYLITTVLGCFDLYNTVRQMMSETVRRLLGRAPAVDPDSWHPRDRAVARWYSWITLAGYVLLAYVLVTALVPIVIKLVEILVDRLHGAQPTGQIVDTVVFAVLSVGQVVLAGVIAAHSRLRRRAARTA
jgi:hypothetical protein